MLHWETQAFLVPYPLEKRSLIVHGSGTTLTGYQFAGIRQTAMDQAGFPTKFGSHSFRIGAVNEAADLGLPPEHIRAIGRW